MRQRVRKYTVWKEDPMTGDATYGVWDNAEGTKFYLDKPVSAVEARDTAAMLNRATHNPFEYDTRHK